jgi:hypothetical protein
MIVKLKVIKKRKTFKKWSKDNEPRAQGMPLGTLS